MSNDNPHRPHEHEHETRVAQSTDLFDPEGDAPPDVDDPDFANFMSDVPQPRAANGFDERLQRVRARRQSQGQPPRRRQMSFPFVASCLGVVSVVVALLLLATFLPPFADANPVLQALTEDNGRLALDSNNTRAEQDGFAVEVLPGDPGEDFEVSIQTASAEDYEAGAVPETGWACAEPDSLPPQVQARGTVYDLATTGTAPAQVGINVAVPEGVEPDLIDLYGWFDGETPMWQFLPSQVSVDGDFRVTDLPALPDCVINAQVLPPLPFASTVLSLGESLDPMVPQSVSRLYISGLKPTPQGSLQGVLPSDVPTDGSVSVIPLITNFTDPNALDTATVNAILGNPEARLTHAANLAAFAQSNGYAGVALDYRGVDPDLRDQFSDFIVQTARALGDKSLMVVVPTAEFDAGWRTGAYDWRAIGTFADEMIIRAPLNPNAFAELMPPMLAYAIGEVNRYKLGVSLAAGVIEDAPDGTARLVSAEDAFRGLTGVALSPIGPAAPDTEVSAMLASPFEVQIALDEDSAAPVIRYSDGDGPLRRFWFSSQASIANQIRALLDLNITNILMADVPDDRLMTTLGEFNNGNLTVTEPELAIQWRVFDAAGNVVVDETVGPNDSVFYVPQAGEGALRFEAALIGDIEHPLGAAELSVADATVSQAPTDVPPDSSVPPTATTETAEAVAQAASPTESPPPPTATVAPPTATPSPEPPTATPMPTIQPTAQYPPELQGELVLSDDFEIGAHFKGFYENIDPTWAHMRRAGMNWMKIQLRYQRGMNPDDFGWQVQFNHENGFKIMWGVVGEPEDLLEPGYFEEYSDFVAQLALFGSDAIEIWNEVNIAREWPQGFIDPVMYTELLRISYEKIKAQNPNTMVISAGLAPTGAEGAFGLENVWNDDRYYQGMAEAGAADYMDCVGAHYNEGIISPTATTGDPRDTDYPTRYLQSNTDRAWEPFNGAVPVCYTELGYVTGEGFGQLPDGFAWANNVTLADQASWLATAALINQQSGKVRLQIIWNLDFKNFDEDPMAGYAIIRPDGSCPACDTFASIVRREP